MSDTTAPTVGLAEHHAHLAAYADAIAAQGPHPALVDGKAWETDGDVIWPAKGGEGYDVADLLPGGQRRQAVERHAAWLAARAAR